MLLSGKPSYFFTVSPWESEVAKKNTFVLFCTFVFVYLCYCVIHLLPLPGILKFLEDTHCVIVLLCSCVIYLLPVSGSLEPPGRHKLWRPPVLAIWPRNTAPSYPIYRGSEQNDITHI